MKRPCRTCRAKLTAILQPGFTHMHRRQKTNQQATGRRKRNGKPTRAICSTIPTRQAAKHTAGPLWATFGNGCCWKIPTSQKPLQMPRPPRTPPTASAAPSFPRPCPRMTWATCGRRERTAHCWPASRKRPAANCTARTTGRTRPTTPKLPKQC